MQPHIRRRARECVLQFLYAWDITREDPESALEAFWSITSAKPASRNYAEKLIHLYTMNHESLDAEIAGVIENWSPQRVGRIEQAAIRMAYTEMKLMPDVPPTVAINEAIEVTKRYGSDEAPSFVNGVLDRLRKNALAPEHEA